MYGKQSLRREELLSCKNSGDAIIPSKELKMSGSNATSGTTPKEVSIPAKSWIQKTPGVCGGDACIRNTRITVWGLVERRNLGASDAEMLDSIPGLTREDLEAAW